MRKQSVVVALAATCLVTLILATSAVTAAPVASAISTKWVDRELERPFPGDEGPNAVSLSLAPAAPFGRASTESTDAVCIVTPLLNDNSTSQNERAPNLRNRFGRAVWLILPGEMAAAGIPGGSGFTSMGFNFQTAPGLSGSNNLIVYMENTADTTNNKSTTWATAISTMTTVHNGAITVPNVTGTWDFTFAGGSPFTYTGGGLYIAFDAQYPVGTLSANTVVWCNSTGLAAGLKGAQSNVAAPATTAASNFRPETRLTPTASSLLNNSGVETVLSYGAIPRDLVGPRIVQATISNHGANARTNVPVTLTVTGANPFTNTKVISSLAACSGQAFVTFAAYFASNLGSDTLTVTLPPDDLASDNTKVVPMNVTIPEYSFKYPGTTAAGGVGLTGATGAFVAKFTTDFPTTITAVELEFAAASATTYRVAVYADNGGGAPGGNLYTDPADNMVAAAGPVTIPIPPVAVGPGDFYVGIQQTNVTNASLSFDSETPLRSGKFFLSAPLPVTTWSDFSPANSFKLNIGVVLDNCADAVDVCEDFDACTNDLCDSISGCSHPAVNCDDGQICTTDACDPGSGCIYAPVDCNDQNPCTDDDCAQGFVLTPPCTVPDNGGGTVNLPPQGCEYLSPSDVHEIVAGLPPGTTIVLGAIHKNFICSTAGGTPDQVCSFVPPPGFCEQPGGSLGGYEECSDSTLDLTLHGTGVLDGWNRTIQLPVKFETHVAPRTPGAPTQSFASDMFRLRGELPIGDPDFDLLRITAGTGFGMPSPGHTTLRSVGGGNWSVDSFFDIAYKIDFVGHPGGHVGGMSGSTTGTIRMQTGNIGCTHTPTTSCEDNNPCTIDSCDPSLGCQHAQINCDDGQICTDDSCNPANGQCVHTPTTCDDGSVCTVDTCVQALAFTPPCTVPDNGGGTVSLPPAGCQYLSPQDVHEIVAGLPSGTTIELGAIHKDFICNVQGGSADHVCSFVPPPGFCEQPGGSLGGYEECSNSSLEMNLHGTGTLGGWDRMIQIPVQFETHVGPRTPGAPTQSFASDMFGLGGQLPSGDPDFDLLHITAGTNFGMPSPGHTTLRSIGGGNFAVDSFFDITYRIDYVGHPGGHIGSMSGSTTGTIRMQTGSGVGCVHTAIDCNDSNVCTDDSCNAITGCQHAPASCDDADPCTNDSCVQAFAANPCTATNTGGTVVLPPPGCAYLSPTQVHQILNGLNPPTANIQFAPIHRDFICNPRGTPPPSQACDPIFASVCRTGSPQAGVDDCSTSTLQLNLHGTGGISIPDRTLNIPIMFQTHQGSRTPGQPVQSFPTDMTRMLGQLPAGDPDFDLLRITGGTANGLPSPGHTTLTQTSPTSFKVDSFFDITYKIDYIGAPGGHLSGMSGSTTGTIRMATGTGVGCQHTPNPAPGEAQNLTATKLAGSGLQLNWAIDPSATRYDAVRGALSGLPVGPVGGDESCLGDNLASPTASDPAIPGVGAGKWYLVRDENACGNGPYGFEGVHGAPGAARNTTTCP